jgi:hypothetical protein
MAFVRCLILVGTIASVASINVTGQNLRARLANTVRWFESIPSRSNAEPLPELLSLPDSRKLSDLEEAYLDSYSILKHRNSCSDFFGGPQAIEVLNELTKQIRPAYLDRRVGFRMTGETTNVLNFRTGFKYRLFDKAEVNLNGPFYQSGSLPNSPRVPSIGRFPPSSREARVTLLLHELGHLIQKPDDQWLLRDDGKDVSQSEDNTQRIIEACGTQIRELHRFSFEAERSQAQYEARNQAAVAEGLAG